MNSQDQEKFYKIWQAAWETCGRTISPAGMRLAFRALEQYPIHDVSNAVIAHMHDPSTGQFPPKPADIIRHIEGSPEDRAVLAWTKVVNAIERHGPYARLVFDDPAIHAALDGGMWASLCNAPTYRDLEFRQKDFVAAYKANIGVESGYPPVLCAKPLENQPDILFIGDQDRAEQVLLAGRLPPIEKTLLEFSPTGLIESDQ